jgi:LuxR family maltose regulon positive regulatory protein
MAQLLAALTKRVGDNNPYLRRLRAAVGSGTHPTKQASGALIDPLSQRELEVLRLLASELSGPEISRHLVVSLNTVRTHTKNIYAKLGATTRREAVKRASELGLLNSPG